MPTRHQEISDALRAEITAGAHPEGAVLPPENELAARYGVSRGTVRQALQTLHQQGLIGSRQGARRVVLRAEPAQSFGELRSFSQWALATGRVPQGQVISSLRRPATHAEAEALQVDEGAEVLHVVRLRHLDDEPVLLERTTRRSPWPSSATVSSSPRPTISSTPSPPGPSRRSSSGCDAVDPCSATAGSAPPPPTSASRAPTTGTGARRTPSPCTTPSTPIP
jgi:hypothetical protein